MSRKFPLPENQSENPSASFAPPENQDEQDRYLAEALGIDFSDFDQTFSSSSNLGQAAQPLHPPLLPLNYRSELQQVEDADAYDVAQANNPFAAPLFMQNYPPAEFPQNFGLDVLPQEPDLPSALYAPQDDTLAQEHFAFPPTLLQPIEATESPLQILERHGFDKNFAHSLFSNVLFSQRAKYASYAIIPVICNILTSNYQDFIRIRQDLPALTNENIADLLDKKTLSEFARNYMKDPSRDSISLIENHFQRKIREFFNAKDEIIRFYNWSKRFSAPEPAEQDVTHLNDLAMIYAKNDSDINRALDEARSFVLETSKLSEKFEAKFSEITGSRTQKIAGALEAMHEESRKRSAFAGPRIQKARRLEAAPHPAPPVPPQTFAPSNVTPTSSAAAFNIGATMPARTRK